MYSNLLDKYRDENDEYRTEYCMITLRHLKKKLNEFTTVKSNTWYNLMGTMYSLLSLNVSEEYLMSLTPIQLKVYFMKIKEIEDRKAERLRMINEQNG